MPEFRRFENPAALGAFVFVSSPIVAVCFYVAALLLATHGLDPSVSTVSAGWLLAVPILVLWGYVVHAIARLLDLRRRGAIAMAAAAVVWTCSSLPAFLLVGDAVC